MFLSAWFPTLLRTRFKINSMIFTGRIVMNNETQHEPAIQSPDSGYLSQYPTDEIDLLDIRRVLVSQRKLILIVTE